MGRNNQRTLTLARPTSGRTASPQRKPSRLVASEGAARATGAVCPVIGLDGALRRIVRGPAQDLSVSRSMLDRYREVTLDDREATWRGALASIGMPMPPGRPAYTDLVIDSDENFWAKRFVPPGDTATGWAVFVASGELLGDVAIPPAKRIFAIGHDFILAHVVDSLDVDKIAVFRLLKAAGRDSAGK